MLPLKYMGKQSFLSPYLLAMAVTLGIPWSAAASPYSLPLLSHSIALCVCVFAWCFSLLKEYQTYWIVCMCAHSAMPNSLQPYRLYSPSGSSVHGIYRQKYWSGLPLLTPGDLPDLGIEPVSLASPALAGGFFTIRPQSDYIFQNPTPK